MSVLAINPACISFENTISRTCIKGKVSGLRGGGGSLACLMWGPRREKGVRLQILANVIDAGVVDCYSKSRPTRRGVTTVRETGLS